MDTNNQQTVYQIQSLESMIENGIIDQLETATLIDDMYYKQIKLAVIEAIKPYQRNGKEIMYYCPSKNSYRIYIPKPLRKEDEAPPSTCKDEKELWKRAYEYLYNQKAKPTVADCYQKWKEMRENDTNISSYTIYTDNVRFYKHIATHPIANKQIRSVTPSDIKNFLREINPNRKISRKELQSVKSILNGVFSYAVDTGIIMLNPILQVKTSDIKCKAINNRDKVYTSTDRQKILDYLSDQKYQTAYTLGIQLMFCLSIRIGELKALRWSDYNQEQQTIYIHSEVVTYLEDGKRMRKEVDHTKIGEGGDRIQNLSERAISILQEAHKLHPDHKPGDYILPTTQGTPLYTNRFNQRLKQICERASVQYLSSHKIRFYSVTAQAKAGLDLDAIRYNAGHLCFDTTLHYIRQAEIDAANIEKFTSIFN